MYVCVCVCVSSQTEDKARNGNENENRRCMWRCDETGDGERVTKKKKKKKKGELKLKQTDISDNNLMRFDLRPPRQRLCGYNRIISAEVLCENRKSHNRVSKGRWQCKGKAVYVQVVKKK